MPALKPNSKGQFVSQPIAKTRGPTEQNCSSWLKVRLSAVNCEPRVPSPIPPMRVQSLAPNRYGLQVKSPGALQL
jgi:hypothetical protein